MTEEVKKPETEDNAKPEIEVQAEAQGWQNEEAWVAAGKAKEDWRPAREYVERGELFQKIESQNKEVKQLRKVLDTLKNHHLNVKQEAMEEAIAVLKRQRDEAKKNEDLGKVLELTEEIDAVKERQTKAVYKAAADLKAVDVPEQSPTFQSWHGKNKWYSITGDDPMTVYANGIAQKYILESGGRVTETDVLEHVEKKIKEKFPDNFKTPRRDPQVESGSGSRDTGRSGSDSPRLTDQEKKIMDTLVKSGAITKEQYLKDIKKYEDSH